MKKVAFIVSHLGSNSDYLVRIINNNPKCHILSSGRQYDHIDSLEYLYKFHSYKNYSGSIYGDQLLFNYSFSCKYLYKICKFIYLIRPPRQTLNEILTYYNKKNAINYYTFRLRRICEMAKQTKNAVLITYDELMGEKASDVISNYLNLADKLKHDMIEGEIKPIKNNFDESTIMKIEDKYEKYFYYLKNLELIRP